MSDFKKDEVAVKRKIRGRESKPGSNVIPFRRRGGVARPDSVEAKILKALADRRARKTRAKRGQ